MGARENEIRSNVMKNVSNKKLESSKLFWLRSELEQITIKVSLTII